MKVGLFFGSFNPIHNGHLAVAEYMSGHTDLDEVWFIVSPQNPLKPSKSLLDDHQRLEMVKLAVDNHAKLKVSDVEFGLDKPSYSINTIHHLKEKYPDHQFVMIIGEDNLSSFEQWKNYEEILRQCMIYVYPRTGVEQTTFHFHPKIKLIKDAPTMNVSATDIRLSVRNGEDVREMLPEKISDYISENKFYQE